MYNIVMRLISLNLWGGKVHSPLIDFIKKHSDQTDIFTFQEVLKYEKNVKTHDYHANLLGELSEILDNFSFYFSPRSISHDPDGKVNIPVEFGQATFIKNKIKIHENNEFFVYKTFNLMNKYFSESDPDFPSLVLYSILKINNKKFMVINYHGLWEPAPKHDTEHRLRASQIIIDHIQHVSLPTIIAGDFNLRIETKSLQMFEDFGMRNLVKETDAPTTRSHFYEERWRKIDKFADYIIVTKNIDVKKFEVLNDEISDHLPLLLDFEI